MLLYLGKQIATKIFLVGCILPIMYRVAAFVSSSKETTKYVYISQFLRYCITSRRAAINMLQKYIDIIAEIPINKNDPEIF